MSDNLQNQPEAGRRPADTGWREALQNATREAAAEFSGKPDEGGEVDDGAEPEAPEQGEAEATSHTDETPAAAEDEPAEAKDEAKDDTDPGTVWDGNPETVPEALKPGLDRFMANVNKGIGKRMRELADLEKRMNETIFRYQEAMAPRPAQQAQAKDSGPPPKPDNDASEAEWDAYHDARAAYNARKVMEKEIAEGRLVTADQYRETADVVAQQNRLSLITSQPGADSDVMFLMSKMVEAEPALAPMLDSDDSALALFRMAKREAELRRAAQAAQDAKTAAAIKANEEAKRKAAAGKSGLARPGGSSAMVSEKSEEFAKRKAGMTPSERLAFLNAERARELGMR